MIHIVSPHIDDAILSLGGLVMDLINKDKSIHITYLFTVSNWTNPNAISGLTYPKDEATISQLRKEEEKSIITKLNYTCDFFDLHDLPLRFGNRAVDEQTIFNEVTKRLQTTITKNDLVFFPLGLDHADHIITHKIGLQFMVAGYQVIFYEDLPYAALGNCDHQKQHSILKKQGLEPVIVDVDIHKKMDLLRHYESQMSQTWLNHIRNYSYSVKDNQYYERYWKPADLNINF
ncbi:MAG TPA: PIG-L family deacetylase [Cyclobacteriaceae bacterium]|nr:PIG-L family deacetylase [Cyclobacteriaceae bacterium]